MNQPGGMGRRRRGPRIAAIGDSVTLGVGDRPGHGHGAGWAGLLAHALGAQTYLNLAANGTRARGLLQTQVPGALMQRPDIVCVTAGGNDVLRGDFDPHEVERCLTEALTRLARPGRLVLVMRLDAIAIFSLLGKQVSEVMARRIELANGAIAAAAHASGAVLVDGPTVTSALGASAWHIDRIHPSPAGHRALTQAALQAVAEQWPQTRDLPEAGPRPSMPRRAWWLVRQGLPWVAKRSRDLVPQVAAVVTHELLEERRGRLRQHTAA